MLGVATVAIIGLPVLFPLALARDVVRFRWRFPTARVYLFVLQYLVNESVEILLAPLLWMQAGFGRRLDAPASIARHRSLLDWSASLLERRGAQLLGLTIEIDDGSLDALGPGPVIVVSRHVSVFDATVPGFACSRAGLRASGVIMAELLADPGFDLIYGRVGSVFIPRDDGPAAVEAIAAMTSCADESSAFIIYPEGRVFSAAGLLRSMEKLHDRDPERAERLAGLRSALPPRPGGLFALLDSVPEADIVIVDHRGLDEFPTLALLADAVPVDRTIRVTAHRIDRSTIPENRRRRILWLDELWLGWDARLGQELNDQSLA